MDLNSIGVRGQDANSRGWGWLLPSPQSRPLVGFQAAVPLTERGFSPAPAQPDQPFLPPPSLQAPLCLPDAHRHSSLLLHLGDKSKQLSFIDTVMKPVITQKKFANKINQSSNGSEWGASFHSEICTHLVA